VPAITQSSARAATELDEAVARATLYHGPVPTTGDEDMSSELLDQWREAIRASGAPPEASEAAVRRAGMELLDWWSQPHRQYHTLGHLAAVLEVVDGYAGHAEDAHLVRLAAWGHDAVYDPKAPGEENERGSARLTGQLLADLRLPPPAVAEVVRLVMLTAQHRAAPDDLNGALLCDADLAILAEREEDYDWYATAIRREYAHVPDHIYRVGRVQALHDLLDRPAIYRIPVLYSRWEPTARANVHRELRALGQR
jgi:predicted metal-dependent HD superfamily phosphohydrolase